MSDFILHLKFSYSNGDTSCFRNCYFPDFKKRLVQTKLSKVVVCIKNESNLDFPGGTFHAVEVVPVNLSLGGFKISKDLDIKLLKPNESQIFELPEFKTFYSGHCQLKGKISITESLRPLTILLTTEILDKSESVSLNKQWVVGTIIEDDNLLTEAESSFRNSFVALIALLVAIASFLNDFIPKC